MLTVDDIESQVSTKSTNVNLDFLRAALDSHASAISEFQALCCGQLIVRDAEGLCRVQIHKRRRGSWVQEHLRHTLPCDRTNGIALGVLANREGGARILYGRGRCSPRSRPSRGFWIPFH